MSKEEWKESGSEMGRAWTTFGKTFVRSAKTTAGKVSDWADDKKTESAEQPESTVYSDGSWKKAGKELGGAFAGMGKTLLHTVGINNDSKPTEAEVVAEAEAKEVKAEAEDTETVAKEVVAESISEAKEAETESISEVKEAKSVTGEVQE